MTGKSLFDYLADAPCRHRDLSVLGEFSKEAARSYLASKVPLNDSIVKIAQAQGLTPDEVSTVVAEANKAVHAHLFKTAANKYVTFDLADPRVILDQLQVPTEKTASVHAADFQRPPQRRIVSDFAKHASAGHQGSRATPKQDAHHAQEKLALAASQAKDAMIVLDAKIAGHTSNFVKIARNMLLGQDFQDRKKSLPFLFKFAMDAGLSRERARNLMEKLSLVMEQQGVIEKVAMNEVDPDLISDEVARTTKVTNGQHPLYILINTLKSDYDRRDMWTDKGNKIKTDLGQLQERISQL